MNRIDGWGGIRTREGCDTPHAFQACALNRSATHPDDTCCMLVVPIHQRRAAARLAGYGRSRLAPSLVTRVYGRGEIRTHDTVAGTPVFETGAFSHSATRPVQSRMLPGRKSRVNAFHSVV